MKYRVIQMIGGSMIVREYNLDTLLSSMAIRGRKHIGNADRPSLRAELRGAPKFEGFVGPAWDGDAIRYEDTKSYAALSA